MVRTGIVALGLSVSAFVPFAQAASTQECQVRVLQALTDDLGNYWKAGEVLPVDIARNGANGGVFCASGGSCLPRKLHGSDALTLLNCQLGPSLGNGDRTLVADPRRTEPATAKAMTIRQNVENKLSSMGFSNPSAGSLAEDYVNHPRSGNGRLVARALAGSHNALAALKRNNP